MAKKKETKQEPIEKQLWKAADKLRKNIDAAEYKHIVLGLIFLKYISDSFEELYAKFKEGKGEYAGADPEDRDEYRAENVFFVPPSARWSYLQGRAKLPEIGKDIDNSMDAIERDNASLKGVLPKVYAKENLDPTSLGQLIDLISNIALGDEVSRSQDILGKVYEYFLGEFALAEGKKGGQFYTPRNVVSLLVELLAPYKGRVFDPCCGSGGMFVQSAKFLEAHSGNINNITIYGQESNQTTWRLAKMNLAIRGIDSSQVKWNNEGSFLNDAHKDLKADYIIANPPFNSSDWGGNLLRNDARWGYGLPPEGNANFAWIQHFIFHLNPTGVAGIVMHGGAASNKGKSESLIRKSLIEKNLVECIIALPTQLFYNTTLPVHLWFINRSKSESKKGKVLMIDAYELGHMIESTQRELSQFDIIKISETYHNWQKNESYSNELGFCREVSESDISEKNYILAPNRFVIKPKKTRKVPYEESIKPKLEEIDFKLNNIGNEDIFKLSNNDKLINYHFTNSLFTNPDKSTWEDIEVQEAISDVVGGAWGNEKPKKDNVPVKVIRGTDLPNIPLFNLKKTPTRYLNSNKVEEIQLQELDIVIEMSGGSKNQPTGRAAIITKELLEYFKVPLVCSNFCKVIRINQEKVNPFWFYLYWQNSYNNGLTTKYENQPSGIKNFQLDEYIESELIQIPPKKDQDIISAYFRSLFQLKNKLSYTSQKINKMLNETFDNIYYEYD
ncbi:N-6 DNA methylase [Xanthomarina spongicola]|uniref:site-specific DNA-methyltransferase (adenine-specific) n=1 Tax=Xanthomarina spongicola TaxID=570520 RepID=A0A316DSP1_9FLAO|nr:N-6 DNA methylase [Xanthomarina spongicola]PWK19633.1 type I restriction system adenine methylase HsdM [Xanthomarina spongicola]